MIAANLHQSEGIMAHWVLRLLQSVALLRDKVALVSIYDSNSSDGTECWLTALQDVLTAMGVRTRIVPGGTVIRKPKQHRIDFLSRVRCALVSHALSVYHK